MRERPEAPVGVGRPPLVVELHRGAAFVLGIDAGGSRVRAVLVDLEGRVRSTESGSLSAGASESQLLREISGVARRAVSASLGQPVLAAAAGISGIVERSAGTVLLSPDLPALTGRPVGRLLEHELGIPVAIDNDDLLAAVGEAAVGAARGCSDVAFVSLGFGLGAGLIVGGRPVRGASSAAGAIAYLAPGPLEERASGRVIPQLYRQARTRGRRLSGPRTTATASDDPRDAQAVFARAAAGDPVARIVIHGVLEALGELVVSLAALINPEVIVVGGGLSRNGEQVLRPIRRRLEAGVPYPPRLALSELGDGAVARGAALLALSVAKQRIASRPGGQAQIIPDPARVGSLQLA